jgi:uncharacterized protein YjbI with pentapeptide repeats
VVVLIAVITLVVKWAPTWLASTHGLSPGERAAEIGRVRTALLAILAGGIAVVGAFYTARTFALNQQGQITDRFSRAIDHLGHKEIDVRLGGIYALERIARESAVDHPPIMEVLTAYLRQHSPALAPQAMTADTPNDDARDRRTQIATDVQAAASVVARRRSEQDGSRRLNLQRVSLETADLTDADLTRADLTDADLTRADLTDANLAHADLTDANLAHAKLTDADLTDANLTRAKLTDADLKGANLTRAKLTDADLTRAYLAHAYLTRAKLAHADLTDADLTDADLTRAYLTDVHLTRAYLTRAKLAHADLTDAHLAHANLAHANLAHAKLADANLTGAYLTGAKLTDVNLKGANLKGADLTGADLTGADLTDARYDETTTWPDDFDQVHQGARLVRNDAAAGN